MPFISVSSGRALLFIRALTPLHAGSGKGSAIYVDLAIQRDEFGFPTVWSSSLKGALKASYRNGGCEKRALFGFEPREQPYVSEYSSALSLTDTRLILIPARVLSGVWSYLTSPHMLTYLNTYSEAAGLSKVEIPSIEDDVALVSKQELISPGERVLINEVDIKAKHDPHIIDKVLSKLPSEVLSNVKAKGLIVVPDSISKLLVDRSMIIQYRVRLTHEKTVEEGALWSEEYLPAESILVSLVVFREKKIKCREADAEKEIQLSISDVRDKVIKEYNNRTIFIGGKETIGRGLVKIYLLPTT
ncbi:MAG: type III-B CRISPR module RAMP protein Cmr4 [Sulfolobales archaeon]|nr:type III-B CRISPR module RAMP protein Cmr4 [Sulfolobales archaeon]